jgi:hypothetical protein
MAEKNPAENKSSKPSLPKSMAERTVRTPPKIRRILWKETMATQNVRAIKPEYDPYAFADEKGRAADYSRDNLYVKSTNKHDHSETVYVKVQPGTIAQIEELVRKVPELRSRGDVIRNALYHDMAYWVTVLEDEDLGRWLNTEMMQAQADMAQQELISLAKLVDSWRTNIQLARNAGDKDALERLYEQLKQQAEQIREPYSSRLIELTF